MVKKCKPEQSARLYHIFYAVWPGKLMSMKTWIVRIHDSSDISEYCISERQGHFNMFSLEQMQGSDRRVVCFDMSQQLALYHIIAGGGVCLQQWAHSIASMGGSPADTEGRLNMTVQILVVSYRLLGFMYKCSKKTEHISVIVPFSGRW